MVRLTPLVPCVPLLQGELMEGDNAYELSRGQRVTALRRTCLSKLPHTLVIHLKRFEFDHLTMQRCGGLPKRGKAAVGVIERRAGT